MSLWPKELSKSFFEYVFSRVKIRPDAKSLFDRLKKLGVKRVIVTSGLNLLAERICKELESDECYSNEMVFDEKGLFTGNIIINVDPSNKAKVLEEICRKYSIPLNESIAIGDTLYDKSMFRITGSSILYRKRGQETPLETYGTHYIVNSLEEVANLLTDLIEKEKEVK